MKPQVITRRSYRRRHCPYMLAFLAAFTAVFSFLPTVAPALSLLAFVAALSFFFPPTAAVASSLPAVVEALCFFSSPPSRWGQWSSHAAV